VTTIDRHHRTGWSRGRWIALGAVLIAVVVALVLMLVYSGGSSGSAPGY
jgi:hypothetical protein